MGNSPTFCHRRFADRRFAARRFADKAVRQHGVSPFGVLLTGGLPLWTIRQHSASPPAIRRHGSMPAGVLQLSNSPTQRFATGRPPTRRWVIRHMAFCHFRASDLSLYQD